MGVQVTLTLSNELYETASRWAALTRHDVSRTLTDALTVVLSPRSIPTAQDKPLSMLTDAEVVALCRTDLNAEAGRRVSALLEKQREGILNSREQQDLVALMQGYDQLWLRQSEALAEAVRRGLRTGYRDSPQSEQPGIRDGAPQLDRRRLASTERMK